MTSCDYQTTIKELDPEGAMVSVALIEPEIPQNTGNIARLCAATNTPLHLVGALGFRIDDRAVRRAGLDYWAHVEVIRHRDLLALRQSLPDVRLLYFSTKVKTSYLDWTYKTNDCLVFGRETGGLPEEVLRENQEMCLTIPMLNGNVRSLNLANSVAIVLYETLRQTEAFKTPLAYQTRTSV